MNFVLPDGGEDRKDSGIDFVEISKYLPHNTLFSLEWHNLIEYSFRDQYREEYSYVKIKVGSDVVDWSYHSPAKPPCNKKDCYLQS